MTTLTARPKEVTVLSHQKRKTTLKKKENISAGQREVMSELKLSSVLFGHSYNSKTQFNNIHNYTKKAIKGILLFPKCSG